MALKQLFFQKITKNRPAAGGLAPIPPKPGPARGGFRGYIVPGPRGARAQGAQKSSGFLVKFWYRIITP